MATMNEIFKNLVKFVKCTFEQNQDRQRREQNQDRQRRHMQLMLKCARHSRSFANKSVIVQSYKWMKWTIRKKIANGHSTLKFVKCTFEQNQDHVKASKKSRLPTAIAHWILLNTFTKDFRVWETPIENVLFKVVRSRRLWAKITSSGKTRSFLKNQSSLKVMYGWNEVFRTTFTKSLAST